jgi:Protein transporter of the TRAM (translocating chain-associating membrane) superfamily, longevity assurance factor
MSQVKRSVQDQSKEKNVKIDNLEKDPLIHDNGSEKPQGDETPRSKNQISLDKYEKIWRTISIFVVTGSLWVTYTLKDFAEWSAKNLPTSAKWSDIYYVATLALFIYFVRSFFRMLLYKPVYDGLEGRYFGEEREQRAQKVVKWVHDTIYYSCTTIFLYVNYRKTVLIDPMLFGEGDRTQLFKNMPGLPDPQEFPYLKEYYLVQMAAHLCTLVEQILFKRDEAKYYEYFLHHFLSFILILNSYMQHELLLGTTVLLTHDMTDVFLASGRSLEAFFKPKGTSLKSILLYSYFGLCLVVWIYCRTICFTTIPIYQSYLNFGNWPEIWPMIAPGWWFSFILILILMVMDTYWSVIMLKIVVGALYRREYKNTYDPKILKKREN